MDPKKRTLLKVEIGDEGGVTADIVEQLMGNKPEGRSAHPGTRRIVHDRTLSHTASVARRQYCRFFQQFCLISPAR